MASAALDRLLHRSTVLNIRGESYRMKERKKAGLLSTLEGRDQALGNGGAKPGEVGKIQSTI